MLNRRSVSVTKCPHPLSFLSTFFTALTEFPTYPSLDLDLLCLLARPLPVSLRVDLFCKGTVRHVLVISVVQLLMLS